MLRAHTVLASGGLEFENNIIPFRGRGARRPAGTTFKDLADEWLRTECARRVEPENERRHIGHLAALWDMTEETLRPARVKEALGRLLAPEGPLGASTVNKVRNTGRQVIREAQLNDRWRGANPFEVVRRLRETKPTHRHLSLPEARALLPHLRPDRRREALVMLYLGLRPGEWKALRREDVDFRAGVLTVRRSNGRNRTKTGKERVVPIPSGLRATLEEALAASPGDCALVFPSPAGARQREDAKLSRMLRAALKRAELVTGYRYLCRRKGCGHQEQRQERVDARCPDCGFKLWREGVPLGVRFYDLRHSAATLHREAGADPLAIQKVMGHAAENLTDSIYTHLSAEYVAREMDKLRF